MKYGVCLIGNYPADQQESMIRYANHLEEILKKNKIPYRRLDPEVNLGTKGSSLSIEKYLRYVDKYVFFKKTLKYLCLSLREEGIPWIIHIVDHSNANYVNGIKGIPVLVTTHDVGAIQGARGELADCQASFFGKLLQKRILLGLSKAAQRVAVSEYTKRSFISLVMEEDKASLEKNTRVILNPIRPEMSCVRESELPQKSEIFGERLVLRYLLNVSSNLRRKNRSVVLKVFSRWRQSKGDKLVFVGEPLSKELLEEASDLGIREEIIDLGKVSNATLVVLYREAFAFIFPSRFEGFGWPIIEAQHHGAPVLSARNSSIPEIAGEGAFLCDSEDVGGMVEELVRLDCASYRKQRQELGFQNVKRFSAELFETEYLKLYQEMVSLS